MVRETRTRVREVLDNENLPAGLNLMNFNARLYNPALGVFLAIDPYADSFSGLSDYAAFGSNPVLYIDPSGEFFWIPFAIGAVIGAYTGGTLANNGQLNPGKWDWQSGKTWGFMLGGAIVGGLSGALAAEVAASHPWFVSHETNKDIK